jgi:hypothetical protein
MLLLFQLKKKLTGEIYIFFHVKKTYRWNLHEKKSKKVAIGGIYIRPRYQMLMQIQIVKNTQQLLNQPSLRITIFINHFYY